MSQHHSNDMDSAYAKRVLIENAFKSKEGLCLAMAEVQRESNPATALEFLKNIVLNTTMAEEHYGCYNIQGLSSITLSLAKYFENINVPKWLKEDLSPLQAYLVLEEIKRVGPESESFHRIEILPFEDHYDSFMRLYRIAQHDVVSLQGLIEDSQMLKAGHVDALRASVDLYKSHPGYNVPNKPSAHYSVENNDHHFGLFMCLLVDNELMLNYALGHRQEVPGLISDTQDMRPFAKFFDKATICAQLEILRAFVGDVKGICREIYPHISKLSPEIILLLKRDYNLEPVFSKKVAFEIVSNSIADIEESMFQPDAEDAEVNENLEHLVALCNRYLPQYPEMLVATALRFGDKMNLYLNHEAFEYAPEDIKEIISRIIAINDTHREKVDVGVQCDLGGSAELLHSHSSNDDDAILKNQCHHLIISGKILELKDFYVRKAVMELLLENMLGEDLAGPFHAQFFNQMFKILPGSGDKFETLIKMFSKTDVTVTTDVADQPPLEWDLTDMVIEHVGAEAAAAGISDFLY